MCSDVDTRMGTSHMATNFKDQDSCGTLAGRCVVGAPLLNLAVGLDGGGGRGYVVLQSRYSQP